MIFKQEHLRAEFDKLKPDIKKLVQELDAYMVNLYGKEIVITRIFEDLGNTDSQHLKGEAVDVRTRNMTVEQATNSMTHLLTKLPRKDRIGDRNALCVYAHGCGSNHHFHLSQDST